MADDAKPLALLVKERRALFEGQGADYYGIQRVSDRKFAANAGGEGVVYVDTFDEGSRFSSQQDAIEFGEALGFKVLDGETIQRVHHVAIGLPSMGAVDLFVEQLVSRGAEIVSQDPKPKYFLRMSPHDVTLLEVFFEGSGKANVHVDYTVADLDGPRAVHGPNILDYEIPNMLFAELPDLTGIQGISVELGFAVRE